MDMKKGDNDPKGPWCECESGAGVHYCEPPNHVVVGVLAGLICGVIGLFLVCICCYKKKKTNKVRAISL